MVELQSVILAGLSSHLSLRTKGLGDTEAKVMSTHLTLVELDSIALATYNSVSIRLHKFSNNAHLRATTEMKRLGAERHLSSSDDLFRIIKM